MKHLKILLPLTVLTTALLSQTAHAHGFGERYDLPIPLTFFAVGGAAAVLLSFVFMGSIFKAGFRPQSYPRFNLFRYPWIEDVLSGPRLLPVKIFSVFLLALVILTGLLGSSRPEDNFSPTFVWVIWWVWVWDSWWPCSAIFGPWSTLGKSSLAGPMGFAARSNQTGS